jgi:hypothetical protein
MQSYYLSLAELHKLRGRLQHAAFAMPSMRGFMTPLNATLRKAPQTVGLGKASELREVLQLFDLMLESACQQPSHITELIRPHLPHVYRYTDASADGAGGVWLPCTRWCKAIVWRVRWPEWVEMEVRKKHGSITNSYVECVAIFIMECLLEIIFDDTAALRRRVPCLLYSPIPSSPPARVLGTCPRSYRDHLSRLIDTVREPAGRGDRLDSSYWRSWARFSRAVGQHPCLIGIQGPDHHLERADVFMAFAVALRQGELDGGAHASHSKIKTTLQYCASYMVNHGYTDPRRRLAGQSNYAPDFRRLMKRFKRADPPPKRQLALPVTTIRWIAATAAESPRHRALGDLITLAYFFLLRVCEYARTSGPRVTQPLRKKDIRLWSGDRLISPDADWDTLCAATSVTICLAIHKNGDKDTTLHHTTSEDAAFNPVLAAARRLDDLRHSTPDTLLSTVATATPNMSVTDKHVRHTIQEAARATNLPAKGFPLNRLGTHSLRAAGATALAIRGYDSPLIRKLGRWRGDTFLIYIQSQIAELTSGISKAMAPSLSFHQVGAIRTP